MGGGAAGAVGGVGGVCAGELGAFRAYGWAKEEGCEGKGEGGELRDGTGKERGRKRKEGGRLGWMIYINVNRGFAG